eukprot:14390378-Ditylum_brightwellii.AAC.1
MKDAYSIFQTRDILEQSHHPFDTQKNEGMNTAIAKFQLPPEFRTMGIACIGAMCIIRQHHEEEEAEAEAGKQRIQEEKSRR